MVEETKSVRIPEAETGVIRGRFKHGGACGDNICAVKMKSRREAVHFGRNEGIMALLR